MQEADHLLLGQLVFEHTSDAYLLLKNRKVTDANSAAAALFGVSETEQLHGQSLALLSPELQEDGNPSKALLDVFVSDALEGKLVRFDWQFNVKGAPFWVKLLLQTLH